MKMSKLFVQTLREFPADADVVSHKFLAIAMPCPVSSALIQSSRIGFVVAGILFGFQAPRPIVIMDYGIMHLTH